MRGQIAASLQEHRAALDAAERELAQLEAAYQADSMRVKAQIDKLRETFPDRYHKETGRKPSHPEFLRYEQQLELRAASMRTITPGTLSPARDKVNRHSKAFKEQMELWNSLFPGEDYRQPPPSAAKVVQKPPAPLPAPPPAAKVVQRSPPTPPASAPVVGRRRRGPGVEWKAEVAPETPPDTTFTNTGLHSPPSAPRTALLAGLTPEEQAIVVTVWRLRAAGLTIDELRDHLNTKGLRPFSLKPGGGRFAPSPTWSHGSVHRFVSAVGDMYQGPRNHGRSGPATGSQGSRVPYGWQMKDGKLIPQTTERWAIIKMLAWFEMGFNARQIGVMLDREGIKPRTGEVWRDNNVRSIIRRHLRHT